MNKEYVQEFYNELCKLEDEYGLYVKTDTWEDWDYDCEDNYYLAGYGSYLYIADEDDRQAAFIDDYGTFHIDEDNCE